MLKIIHFSFVFFIFFIISEILLEMAIGFKPGMSNVNEFIVLALVNTSLGLIPAIVASKKGRGFYLWWLYGYLLFIIATIHSVILKPNEKSQLDDGMKKCQFCAEIIKPDASVCRYCGKDLPQ